GTVGFLYRALRRRRPSIPKPTSAPPRSVSDAGSGTEGNFSPLEIPAVAEAVVVANWSRVVQLAAGVQTSAISIQSNVSLPPTAPNAATNAASPEIAVVVPVPKNFGWGVLSWIIETCQVSVMVSPSGFV